MNALKAMMDEEERKKEEKRRKEEALYMGVSGATVKQPDSVKRGKYPLPAGQVTIGVRG